MGTHPIFESDFDCLTDCKKKHEFQSRRIGPKSRSWPRVRRKIHGRHWRQAPVQGRTWPLSRAKTRERPLRKATPSANNRRESLENEDKKCNQLVNQSNQFEFKIHLQLKVHH